MLGPRSTSFLAVLVCWSWTECSQQQLDSLPSSLAQAFMLLMAVPNFSSSAIRKSNLLLWEWNVCIVIWQQWPASTNDKVSWVKAAIFGVCAQIWSHEQGAVRTSSTPSYSLTVTHSLWKHIWDFAIGLWTTIMKPAVQQSPSCFLEAFGQDSRYGEDTPPSSLDLYPKAYPAPTWTSM